ncbi:MAG: hypothetical protein VYA34_09690 [Myxococcota bacterium]|nr:hypothetical protein [Myxococcota bacterium]
MSHESFDRYLASRFHFGEGVMEQAAERQNEYSRILIGAILLEIGMVTQRDLDRALEIQIREVCQAVVARPRRLGELLIEQEVVLEEQLQRALAIQRRRRHMGLSDILVEMGALSQENLDEAKAQWNQGGVSSVA